MDRLVQIHGNKGDQHEATHLGPGGYALVLMVTQFGNIVPEAHKAVAHKDQAHLPDIAVREIRPEEQAHKEGCANHDAAHGGCSCLLLVGLDVREDVLAALYAMQKVYEPGTEDHHDEHGSHKRSHGAEGDVAKDV